MGREGVEFRAWAGRGGGRCRLACQPIIHTSPPLAAPSTAAFVKAFKPQPFLSRLRFTPFVEQTVAPNTEGNDGKTGAHAVSLPPALQHLGRKNRLTGQIDADTAVSIPYRWIGHAQQRVHVPVSSPLRLSLTGGELTTACLNTILPAADLKRLRVKFNTWGVESK